MPSDDFKKGDVVTFLPGARSVTKVKAKVTGRDESGIRGAFLITVDDTGFERKVRPGSCTKVG